MKHEDYNKASFLGVAILLILAGAGIFAYGAVGWGFDFFRSENAVAIPSIKIIGGLVVLALGYILLELDCIRKQ